MVDTQQYNYFLRIENDRVLGKLISCDQVRAAKHQSRIYMAMRGLLNLSDQLANVSNRSISIVEFVQLFCDFTKPLRELWDISFIDEVSRDLLNKKLSNSTEVFCMLASIYNGLTLSEEVKSISLKAAIGKDDGLIFSLQRLSESELAPVKLGHRTSQDKALQEIVFGIGGKFSIIKKELAPGIKITLPRHYWIDAAANPQEDDFPFENRHFTILTAHKFWEAQLAKALQRLGGTIEPLEQVDQATICFVDRYSGEAIQIPDDLRGKQSLIFVNLCPYWEDKRTFAEDQTIKEFNMTWPLIDEGQWVDDVKNIIELDAQKTKEEKFSIDFEIFEGLGSSIGQKTFKEVLKKLQADLVKVRSELIVAKRNADLDQIVRSTHVLLSLAGSFGAYELQAQSQYLNALASDKEYKSVSHVLQTCVDEVGKFIGFVVDELTR